MKHRIDRAGATALVLLSLIVGCTGPVLSPRDAGGDAGTAEDAGPETDAGPERDAGPGTDAGSFVDLEVNVVARVENRVVYEPFGGTLVRVDGSDGSTYENETDAAGSYTFRLPAESVPWTVTVARPGYTATSIFDVTGPIAGAIHLLPIAESPPSSPRVMSGSITGRTTSIDEHIAFYGPDITGQGVTGDVYSAELLDGFTTNLRLQVVEWDDPVTDPPRNAVWIDIDRSLADLSGIDIVFPSPPRAIVDTPMTITVPTTGLLSSSTFTVVPNSPVALRRQDEFWYPVGRVSAVESGAGTFDANVRAFDGDMAASHASLRLTDSSAVRILMNAPVVSGSTFDVPSVEQLDAGGSSLADIVLTWNAPAYSHLGASATSDGARGGWFIYSYSAEATEISRGWPELPGGLTLADLNLGTASGAPNVVNTFALTYEDGVMPWEFSRHQTQRAVLVVSDIPH